MPYRLQFKGDPEAYTPDADPLFAETAKWKRAKILEKVTGLVGILYDNRIVSPLDLSLHPLQSDPQKEMLFTAVRTDGQLSLKAPNGNYLELRHDRSVAIETAAMGPTSQLTLQVEGGLFTIKSGRSCLAVNENKLVSDNTGAQFVIIVQK